jgi:AraC-like DNA-binding protein
MAVQRDPLPEWREQVGRLVLRLDFKPLSDVPFAASVNPIFEEPRIVRTVLSPGIVFRDADLVKDGNDSFALLIGRSKNIFITHQDRDLRLGRGDATLLHNCAIGTVGSAEELDFVPVMIPYADLAARAACFENAIARKLPRQSEALQLLRAYVSALEKGHFGREGWQIIRQHIIDLSALAITQHGALGESSLSAVVGARRRAILDHIALHFSNPDLSPTKVARDLCISPRYLQRLLEASETSFTEHVNELRLKRAFTLLSTQSEDQARISDIALRAGFSDISHFNRLFRARFGDTPSGVRARGDQSEK